MTLIPPMVSIREVRRAHGLSARELADRIATEGVEVDPNSLLNIELGYKGGSPSLMKAWALALRLNPLDVHRPDDLRARLAEIDAEAGAA